MSLPARRVVAGAIAAHLGVVEHRLDAAPHLGSRLGTFAPQGLQHLHNVVRVDQLDRHVAEDVAGHASEMTLDLLNVLRILPGALPRLEVFLHRLGERHDLVRIERLLDALRLAGRNRIDAIVHLLAVFSRP